MPSLTSHVRPNKSCLFNLSGAVAIPCPEWQKMAGFRRTEKMPSILSTGTYFILRNKKMFFLCILAKSQPGREDAIFCVTLDSFVLIWTKENSLAFKAQ